MSRGRNRNYCVSGNHVRFLAVAVVGISVSWGGRTAAWGERVDYLEERDLLSVRIAETDEISVYMGLKTVGRIQGFDQRRIVIPQRPGPDGEIPDPLTPDSLEWGAQYPFGSMDFLAEFDDGNILTYWEFFIASRPHASEMQGSQGYILFRGLPGGQLDRLFEFVEIKAGQFEVNFGDHIYRRSANARVQQNALIGNNLVDPRATETGFEVRTRRSPVHLSLGLTDGSESEDFSRGRGIGYNAKIWGHPMDQVRVSLSGYYADHSRNPAGRDGSRSNMHRTLRDGGPYGGILDDGGAPGQVFIGDGQKVAAGQLDLTTRIGPVEVYGNIGYAEDSDVTGGAPGTFREAFWYYTLESVLPLTERLYGAARFGTARADKVRGEDSSGYVNRYQAGLGYRLTDHILAKGEYVYQHYRGFDEGQMVSGVDAGHNPAFHGLLVEVSLAF